MRYELININYSKEKNELFYSPSPSNCLPEQIVERLYAIELGLIEEAINQQYQKIGFSSIGNQLWKRVGEHFGQISNEIKFVRATENQRASHRLIFEWVEANKKNQVYVFIFDKEFGSKLVDRSTLSLQGIKASFKDILKVCEFNEDFNFHVIEVNGLNGAEIVQTEKNKGKVYYKILKK
jgi:hypothetical protein